MRRLLNLVIAAQLIVTAAYASRANATLNCSRSCVSDECSLSCDLSSKTDITALLQISGLKIEGESDVQQFESKSKSLEIKREFMSETLPTRIGLCAIKIEKFAVSNSRLTNIERANFQGMGNLKILDLSSNQIETIPDAVFADLTELEVLNLDHNRIAILPTNILASARKLREFHGSFNAIQRLAKGIFKNCTETIEVIYLENNELKYVNENFTAMKKVEVVDLRRNSDYCTECPIIEKSKRTELLNACSRNHFTKKKQASDNFEGCVRNKTSEREEFESKVDICFTARANRQKFTEERFRNCSEAAYKEPSNTANRVDFNKLNKAELCIFELTTNEQKDRENFKNCIDVKRNQVRSLGEVLTNCYGDYDGAIVKAQNWFANCMLCDQMNNEDNVKKCELRFVRYYGDDLAAFQRDVAKFFVTA